MRDLIQIELNEVNFDYVLAYGEKGRLPTLNRLIRRHGITETISESEFDHLEPWIQWVTAHTGRKFAEHGVFRLGDIVEHPELRQIWEELEAHGISVGAVSPMNAANRCQRAKFFLPDPWTRTAVTGTAALRRLYRVIAGLVNDNAAGNRFGPQEALVLIEGLARFGRFINFPRYGRLAARSFSRPWTRALVLDLLLADVFVSQVKRSKPSYATLFLNAAAHIQHHYMFNAGPYRGAIANPDWYVAPNHDPVLEVYSLYDTIVGQVLQAFPKHRLILATGLHQDPYPKELFYWRLVDHAAFLTKLEIAFDRVEPRMSRDFVIYCSEADQARRAAERLALVTDDAGEKLFEVDNRGDSLFVMLSYPHNISSTAGFRVGNRRFARLREYVALVALKNGEHNGVGYLLDTVANAGDAPSSIPLGQLHARALAHFGLESVA